MYKFNLLLFLMISSIFVWGQNPYEDETESPYFLVHTDSHDGKSKPQLPLVSTNTKIKIAGVIADVEITQTYTNQGNETIHAEYVFPGSTKSAVYGMEMKIGERVIKAKIKEKQEAQQIFEEAKKAGKSASLLEQERPNVFKMAVSNILPQDTIKIILHYTENITPEEGIYEFVCPTAVGPRYVDSLGTVEEWTQNPFVSQNEDGSLSSTTDFNLNIDINTGLPLQEIISPSHQLDIQYKSKESAHIRLKRIEEANKDFILHYRLANQQIQSGILVHEGPDENFFMMMMEPPKRVLPEQIPPREYIFIIDVSGSMHGFPIETSKVMMRNLLKNLRETDQFNVLLFASGYSEYNSTPVNATEDNIEDAIDFIDKEPGSGGTELLNALEKSLKMTSNRDISRSFVILTDGYINVEKKAFDLISDNLNKANFFPIGIGNSVNHYLIEGMAHIGHTDPLIVTDQSKAAQQAEKFRKYIEQPVLTNINVNFDGFDAYDIEPKNVHDLFAEKPIVVFGKFKGKPKGTIKVTGTSGQGKFEKVMDVSTANSENNEALCYLWARNKIMYLSDYNTLGRNYDELFKQKITELGLKYSLLTEYTSFVGVDNEVRKQPQTHQFSSNSSSGAVPEPHEWALIILVMGIAGYLMYTRIFKSAIHE